MTTVATVRAYLTLSIAAGAMALYVALAGDRGGAGVEDIDRTVVSLALSVVAVVGVSMALRPNWRRRLAGRRESPGGDGGGARGGLPGPPRRGHHPECQPFSGHTLEWRGRTICAGCTGLAVGGTLVVGLSIAYAVATPSTSEAAGPVLVVTGLALVALELVAAAAGLAHPQANATLNALMVLGFASVSIGLLEATGTAAWGLLGVLLSLLWMDSRAQLSRQNHVATCAACPEDCSAYPL